MWQSFRILLTENCNANCPNCFNRATRTGTEISLDNVGKICVVLKNLGVHKIKVMGGEPTTHSHFIECIELFQSYFRKIIIFTNALNEKLELIKPRSTDIIDYNMNFISLKTSPKKFLLEKPGCRAFEIQISGKSDIDFITKKLSFLLDVFQGREIHLFLTCDCTTNIFDCQKEIIAKWKDLVQYIESNPLLVWHLDHMIPKCFFSGEKIEKYQQLSSKKCLIDCAGLIDANLNILFCNQFHDYICNFNEFACSSSVRLEEMFRKSLDKKNKHLPISCMSCKDYNIDCNGGCFMHKDLYQ